MARHATSGFDLHHISDLNLDSWAEAFDLLQVPPHVLTDLVGQPQRMTLWEARPRLDIPAHRFAPSDKDGVVGLFYDPGVRHLNQVNSSYSNPCNTILNQCVRQSTNSDEQENIQIL